jgi:nucleoside-diphosphate-sugar epimerase
MEKKLIIVTGSCGRIGTQVVKRLSEKYTVVGFDLMSCPLPGQDDLIQVNLGSDESVERAFDQIKRQYGTHICSVIHLAAYYSFSEKSSPKYQEITVKGTERLLERLKQFEVEQFLFTSTMLIHAPTAPGKTITEESPIAPTWDYPLSKVQTEELIHEKRGHIPTVLLRIAGVYDDQCHSIPISHQIQRIYEKQLEARLFSGDINHGAAFVHMDDVVDAIALAVEKRKELPPETPLLVGEPQTLSYDQLQRSISRLLFNREIRTFRVPKKIAKLGAWVQCLFAFKKKPFIRPWMIDLADDHYEMDVSKAKKLLGWAPKRSLEKTLPIMIEALKKDPEKWYKVNQLDPK